MRALRKCPRARAHSAVKLSGPYRIIRNDEFCAWNAHRNSVQHRARRLSDRIFRRYRARWRDDKRICADPLYFGKRRGDRLHTGNRRAGGWIETDDQGAGVVFHDNGDRRYFSSVGRTEYTADVIFGGGGLSG